MCIETGKTERSVSKWLKICLKLGSFIADHIHSLNIEELKLLKRVCINKFKLKQKYNAFKITFLKWWSTSFKPNFGHSFWFSDDYGRTNFTMN